MIKRFLVSIAIVVGTAGLAHTQTSRGIEANIPFDFFVGNKQMTAGTYQVSADLSSKVLLVRSADWRDGAMTFSFSASIGKVPEEALLVFNKYGADRHFLAQIWYPGNSTPTQVVKSKKEREVVTSTIISLKSPETVTILARVR
jgi:hypothetical protein